MTDDYQRLKYRVEMLEKQISQLRDIVDKNTNSINKLQALVAAIGAKIDTLVDNINRQNDIILNLFNQTKQIVDMAIKSRNSEFKTYMKMHTHLSERQYTMIQTILLESLRFLIIALAVFAGVKISQLL